MSDTPKARTADLCTERLDGGVVVYDLQSHEAHWLDEQAAGVWHACNGSRPLQAIAEATSLDRAATAEVLERLGERRLLVEDAASATLSRRAMLRRVATSGAAVAVGAPLISTFVIPAAAAHASTHVPPSPPPNTPPSAPPSTPQFFVSPPPPSGGTPGAVTKRKPTKKKHHKRPVHHHAKRRRRHRPKPHRRTLPGFTG